MLRDAIKEKKKSLGQVRLDSIIHFLEKKSTKSQQEQLIIKKLAIPQDTLVVRMHFFINPEATNNTKYSEDVILMTSYGEILIGDVTIGEHDFGPGDIIRLKDEHTRTVMNPKFQAMKQNKSNAIFNSDAQELPTMATNMFFEFYGRDIVKIDPAGPETIDDGLTISVYKDDVAMGLIDLDFHIETFKNVRADLEKAIKNGRS